MDTAKLAHLIGSTVMSIESMAGYKDRLRFLVRNAEGEHYITIQPDKHLRDNLQVTTHRISGRKSNPPAEEPLA